MTVYDMIENFFIELWVKSLWEIYFPVFTSS
jgi:hypothetical protein